MKDKLHIMHSCLSTLIGAIEAAREGLGTVLIRASKSGLSISVNGKVVAKGKTPTELHKAFQAAVSVASKKTSP